VSTIVRRAYPPELDEAHLLACVCGLKEFDLGGEESGSINAVSG
jgi:hypothetical protein